MSEAQYDEEALGKAYDSRLIARLWRYVAPYKRLVLLTLFMVPVLFFIELAPAWIVKTGLDHVFVDTAGSAVLVETDGIGAGALSTGAADAARAARAAGADPAGLDRLFETPLSIAPLL